MRTLVAVALVSSAIFAQTPAKPAPDQGPPPRNLAQRADGHFSANQDPANPEKFEVYMVKPGDTLGTIAGQILKNPQLWPQLWEQNEQIVNPHWIYPNDQILIRPITPITEAAPPPPPAPEPPHPAPQPEVAATRPPPPVPQPPPAPPAPVQDVFALTGQRPASEVKFEDLHCSGFVRKAAVPKDLKVIAKFDAAGGVLSAETEYVYLSQGSEDGIMTGSLYQVIRPTTAMVNPTGRTRAERDLGMHYLDVGQLRVTLTQPDFALARVLHTCGDAVEIGDTMLPFQQINLPPRERARPFGPLMTTTGGVKGAIVGTKDVLLNFGSTFKVSGVVPGVRGGRLGSLDRGIASEGTIVYLDIGQESGVNAGDIFIVFREMQFDERLYNVPREAQKLRGIRTAIGELIVIKVNERASTALVTYASDALSLGDAVERR